MLKSICLTLVLSLMLPFAQDAAAGTPESRPSFKSGFSSQKSAPAPRPSFRPSSRSDDSARAPARAPGGGFGSFGRAAPADTQRSDSALSRQLTRQQAEENALRTLEARRARSAANQDNYQRDGRYAPNAGMAQQAPAPQQPPVIVHQNSGGGFGNVVAGAIVANAITSHANAANRQAAPAPNNAGGQNDGQNDWGLGPKDAAQASGPGGHNASRASGGTASFARLFLWLCVLALLGAAGYFGWRRVRRRREANKPNYSFERN